MQAADDVKFRGALGDALSGALPDFFLRVGVSAGGILVTAKGAEAAMGTTDVRRIDVAIDVVVAGVAVALFADVIGEPADGEKIVRLIKRKTVFGGEALGGEDFLRDGLKTLVVNGWLHHGFCRFCSV